MKPPGEIIELDVQQMERQLQRIEEALGPETAEPFRLLLRWYVWLVQLIERKNTSIRRLRTLLFGARTERLSSAASSSSPPDQPQGQPAPDQPQDQPAPDHSPAGSSENAADQPGSATGRPRRRPRVGHGRTPAAAYTGCPQVLVQHSTYCEGDDCPFCQQGTLYRRDPKVKIRLVGQTPVGGTRYELEQFRCGLCGHIVTAEEPDEAKGSKHDPSVAAVVATLRYGQGLPLTRIAKLQRAAGIPLAASVQWELVCDALNHGVEAVYQQLLAEAAQGDLVHNDDTRMRILELMGRLKQGQPLREDQPDRRGVFTTGILSLAQNRPPIALFFTGPRHSGENLSELLSKRLEELPPPLQMCDALSHNMPAELKTIVANCLAHARRNFFELKDVFGPEVRYVLGRLAEVYRVDALAKEKGLSPEERLRLHQHYSGPAMDRLHKWLNKQLDERWVEPNSSLGQAISYMLRHWNKLTLFLRKAGAPLDNNICERALKMAIRHRKNSLFYKTERGAEVGDRYMSLIHTCNLSKADPFDYITQVQRNEERVKEAPKLWLPWSCRQQIDGG